MVRSHGVHNNQDDVRPFAGGSLVRFLLILEPTPLVHGQPGRDHQRYRNGEGYQADLPPRLRKGTNQRNRHDDAETAEHHHYRCDSICNSTDLQCIEGGEKQCGRPRICKAGDDTVRSARDDSGRKSEKDEKKAKAEAKVPNSLDELLAEMPPEIRDQLEAKVNLALINEKKKKLKKMLGVLERGNFRRGHHQHFVGPGHRGQDVP